MLARPKLGLLVALLTLAMLPTGQSQASNGDLLFRDCIVARASSPTTGCTNLASETTALDFVDAVVVSPDGRHVYTGAQNHIVAHFTRDPATGTLAFSDCVAGASVLGCTDVSGGTNALTDVSDLAISPDSKHLYAAGRSFDAVTHFTLTNGELVSWNCIAAGSTPATGCTNVSAATNSMDNPSELALDPGGSQLYVAGFDSDSVTVLGRNTSTGNLSFAAPGCVTTRSATTGCGGGNISASSNSLNGTRTLSVSPGGTDIYAGAFLSDSLVQLSRAPTTGALAFVGCVSSDAATTGCGTGNINTATNALNGPQDVAVAPNGSAVYLSAFQFSQRGAFISLARSASGTPTFASCLTQSPAFATGCTDTSATTNITSAPGSVVAAPDGENVYAMSGDRNGIANLSTAGSGIATLVSCITAGAPDSPNATGCAVPAGVGSLFSAGRGMAISPDGLSVYATSGNNGVLAHFQRQLVPACSGLSRDLSASTSIPFSCSDRNGDQLTYQIDSQPQHGSLGAINQAGGAVSYTPDGDFSGSDSFTYGASDGIDSSAAATIALNVTDKTAPALKRLRIAPATVISRRGDQTIESRTRRRRASRISFRLSEAAKVKIAVQHREQGRRVGKKCRKRSRANSKRARCIRYVTRGSIVVNGRKGANKKRFNGRLRGKRLRTGRYRLAARATDRHGNKSKRALRKFRVSRARNPVARLDRGGSNLPSRSDRGGERTRLRR